MAKKIGLGRGLDALYESSGVSLIGKEGNNDILKINISFIEPKENQPREDFNEEALAELADSIAEHGVIQPIAVRKLEDGYYQIIAGERRWRASKMAGLSEIPAVVLDVDEYTAAKMTLVENLQRENLNPVEEALGYKFLMDRYNMDKDEIAKQISKSRSFVSNSLRLLALPEPVLTMLRQSKISAGHAKALLSLEKQEEQIMLAKKVEELDWSVREVERYVKEKKGKKEQAKLSEEDPELSDEILYIDSLQSKIKEILGASIKIKRKRNNASGKLEISYKNREQLEHLICTLCGEDVFKD